jgi:hypothetical protein
MAGLAPPLPPLGGDTRVAVGEEEEEDEASLSAPLLRARDDAGGEEAFEAAQQAHARYGSGALRAAVFGFSGKTLACARARIDGEKTRLTHPALTR